MGVEQHVPRTKRPRNAMKRQIEEWANLLSTDNQAPLSNLSSGCQLLNDAADKLLGARTLGQESLSSFINDMLAKGVQFFDSIK